MYWNTIYEKHGCTWLTPVDQYHIVEDLLREQLFSWIMTISIHPSSNLTAVSCRCWPVTITKPNLNSSEASYYNCNLTLVCVDRRLCNPFDSVELEDKVECGELFLQWRSRSSSLLRRIQWRSNLQNKTLRNKVT